MRIAVLSDVHGNALALEAVLDDLRSATPDKVFSLGDCVAGPFDPARSADMPMALDAVTIAGNQERGIREEAPSGMDVLPRSLLSRSQLNWIASLPTMYRSDDVVACHGSPRGGDTDSLLEVVRGDRTILADERQIAAKLEDLGSTSLVLCGHTHIPRAAQIGNTLVLNPGSVGMPAFRLKEPPMTLVMETGTPHARYALATRRRGGWSFEMRAIIYNWEGAAEQAVAHGYQEVATWTRLGRA